MESLTTTDVGMDVYEHGTDADVVVSTTAATAASNKNLLLCRRMLKDASSDGYLRHFNSLPLFVYATSASTHATSADGVGVAKEVAAAVAAAAVEAIMQNDAFDPATNCTATIKTLTAQKASAGSGSSSSGGSCFSIKHTKSDIVSGGSVILRSGLGLNAMECLPLSGSGVHHNVMAAPNATAIVGGGPLATAAVVVGASGGVTTYPHHLNLNHHHHHLLSHHTPYSNNYPLHHAGSHHHIHSEQAKSLQELQHEVGALLEFRDLVIETFPDLKHKMASMTSSSTMAISANVGGANSVGSQSVSSAATLTGGVSGASLASRREWEPGIRIKRKISHKEPSTAGTTSVTTNVAVSANGAAVATELSSSSLTRSRSNSHSGKKEPKSGENNGSVVQDSGFSTETSSSKEGHSASSTNGAMTVAIASNRLSCQESDDELLNLLDVIHRKSNRLREEVEHLQNYERQQLHIDATDKGTDIKTATSTVGGLTPKTFREQVERLNREDIKQLRRERDRLLDKLAEMEAETLTGRIKAAKMSDQVEELISVKKDLEEQLKLAMAQKLELNSRVQQMQLQQSKSSSSSQSEYSSQRNFLSSATTVLSTDSAERTQQQQQRQRQNTFQPVVIEQAWSGAESNNTAKVDEHLAFHQSSGSDIKSKQQQLGRLDGIVSTPGGRNTKCRVTDSKRFAAILLETNVLELQRHLLTLTVQNQVLMQKLESSTKSKSNLVKRLDKTQEDVEDLRFQLEEKNIELEGTKAQLRVLESRITHSSTPIGATAANSTTSSYLQHSQNDYETNRSSASTTLMLSRRGGINSSVGESNYSVDARSSTPISTTLPLAMPPPTTTQISTPSMKAMVHLPMDEIQQHSSSTESAHEHEISQEAGSKQQSVIAQLMSASVGGISPFEQTPPRGQHSSNAFRKFGSASKPSKIPLPGSKAAAYFASGKPPTGRPSTAGRSPTSSAAVHSTTGTTTPKSSLSRSTGNLMYGKSPNSLKRADSAQSIRKDTSNTSLSTNTSRSSTSSSIPLATTPYSSTSVGGTTSTSKQTQAITPSQRVLQNSPLPKLKRESFASRIRHLDSLSRAQQQQPHPHQQQQQQQLNNSSNSTYNHSHSSSSSTATANGGLASNSSVGSSSSSSLLVSSTPKPTSSSSITSLLSSSVRKDLQLGNTSNYPQQHAPASQYLRRTSNSSSVANVARRFSSASIAGARIATAREQAAAAATAATLQHELNTSGNSTTSSSGSGNVAAHFAASDSDSGKNLVEHFDEPNFYFNNNKNEQRIWQTSYDDGKRSVAAAEGKNYRRRQWHVNDVISEEEEETAYDTDYSQYTTPESMDCGSDNLLVTFDYGYSDSIVDDDLSQYDVDEASRNESVAASSAAATEDDDERLDVAQFWPQAAAYRADTDFQVHYMQYKLDGSALSMTESASLIEYDVDEYVAESSEGSSSEDDDEEAQFYDSIECV